MPSVFRRNDRWYIHVKGPTGKWVRKPTSANSKTEAKQLAEELQRAYERQRLGLSPILPKDGGETVSDLLRWWLATYSATSASHGANVSRVNRHIERSELGEIRLHHLRSGDIESFLQTKAQELSSSTVNHLRNCISRAFTAAIRTGRFTGTNPAREVKPRKVSRKQGDYLRPGEVPHVLAALPPQWRPLFATAIYTGLRRGELFALRKCDVDLDAGLLMVGRSHERNVTKGGRVDIIPIATDLRPILNQAIATSTSELLFPAPDGGRWSRHTKLPGILRRALGRAGIVLGYTQVCRRHGCKYSLDTNSDESLFCPVDNHKLWPKARVRNIRFHDLRHTTGSLLLMSGASPAAVQRILRHADPRITMDVYGHLAPEFLRSEIDRLQFDVVDETPRKLALGAKRSPFIPILSPKKETE